MSKNDFEHLPDHFKLIPMPKKEGGKKQKNMLLRFFDAVFKSSKTSEPPKPKLPL